MSNDPKNPPEATTSTTNTGTQTIDPIPNAARDLISQTMPRAFGGFSEQRKDDINDDRQYPAGQAADNRSGPYKASQPYTPADFDSSPYPETIIVFQHSARGIRASIQMRTRVFLVIVLTILFLFGFPAVGDRVYALLKLVLTGN